MDKPGLNIDFASFSQVVREFIRSLGQRRTYNLFKNWYCFFGILWGIPIPIVTIGIDLYTSGLAVNISNIVKIINNHSFHTLFILHPLFFGIVFGAMGTVRHNKEQEIEEFERNLINKNLELKSVNKKLQELDKLKSNFLSLVSHELRTPLTTIQGYVTFLRTEKSGALNEAQRDYLKISEETADHLNRLIEELLDLSKIETGEFRVNLTSVNILEAINKVTASLQLLAGEKGIIIENNLPNDLPTVLADKERITQVVTNLVENAIKFNREGGKVNITACPSAQKNKILFCVSDTGIGIAEGELDKIFDKFYQVDSSEKRKYGGCGLGLAISKNIIRLHKGRIWAESNLESGSKFFFELLAAS